MKELLVYRLFCGNMWAEYFEENNMALFDPGPDPAAVDEEMRKKREVSKSTAEFKGKHREIGKRDRGIHRVEAPRLRFWHGFFAGFYVGVIASWVCFVTVILFYTR